MWSQVRCHVTLKVLAMVLSHLVSVDVSSVGVMSLLTQ